MNPAATTGGAVLICDRDGRATAVHPVGAGVPGLRSEMGAPFPVLFGLEPFGHALDLFTALRRDGTIHDWPLHAALSDGTTRVVYLSGHCAEGAMVLVAAAQPGAADAVCAAVGQARPELAALLGPLTGAPVAPSTETLFEEMTSLNSQLANAQRALAKANAELEAVNTQKARLLAMLAHDLRTPLHVIGGFAKVLQGRLVGGKERDRDALERIRESSLFMRHLIEDVLSMSALEAGRLTLAPKDTDLGALVRRNVAMNEILALGKGLSMDCQVAEGLPTLPLDAPRIEQVMNNLLSNAVKYSDAGTCIRVTVEACGGDRVRVSVADHGRGIAADQVARLFQPFSHANTLTDIGDTSVGLGLFICRSIVEAHGGSIGVESEPGRGSTFHVELPVSAVHG